MWVGRVIWMVYVGSGVGIAVLIWWSGGRACGWSCGGVRLCCWVVWVARDGYRFGVGLAGWSAGWLDGSGARWKWTMLRIPIQDGLRFAYPSNGGGICLYFYRWAFAQLLSGKGARPAKESGRLKWRIYVSIYIYIYIYYEGVLGRPGFMHS